MIKTWAFVLFFIGCCSIVDAKKALPVEKESPPSESEIICFAAMEKWVCAPASDQQVAKEKAMRLIEDKSEAENVVIQTLASEQQWQEAVIEEPIVESNEASVESKAAQNLNASSEDHDVNPIDLDSDVTQSNSLNQTEMSQTTQSQNFKDWQNNHPQQWTLQAVGTTSLSNLEDFINFHQLGDGTMSIATTEVKGAPWHIILVGLFDDRDQALAYKVQATQQGAEWATQAWPRPINGVATID